MTTYVCPLCGDTLRGVHTITRHRDNLKKPCNDPTRCDNRKRGHTLQHSSAESSESSEDSEDSAQSLQEFMCTVVEPDPVPATTGEPPPDFVIVRPLEPVDWMQFTRRGTNSEDTTLVATARLATQRRRDNPNLIPRDLKRTQTMWSNYIKAVYDLCSSQFWNFFLPLHQFSAISIDTALRAAAETFVLPGARIDNFPLSKRTLMAAIDSLPSFWPHVMCETQIKVPPRLTRNHLQIPQRLKVITFRFIDPIWAWLSVAFKQPADSLHWIPKVKLKDGEKYYGAGVQYGESFAAAFRTCPAGSYPMLVQLSWDGAHAHGCHATPICVGVGNTNSLAADTKFCIGYMPVLEDMGAQYEGVSTEIRSFIKQQCIAGILRVIESAARIGVRVSMPYVGSYRSTRDMWLMPRLSAMNLDLKDARMYYGLRSEICCSKCKRRKGRSAFRRASKQSGRAVQALYDIVETNDNERLVRLASEKLSRWGFHPDRRCLLPIVCREALIRRPGHEDEVFPAVDFRDRMHGLFIFIHRQICECFVRMALPQATRVRLDRRLTEIGLMRVFKDPKTGTSYRVQRSLFTEAHMSAADRVCTLFFIPHVIGHRALDFPEPAREPLLTALAMVQVFAVASRGGRSYNERELREIFERGWVVCFGALERLYQMNFTRKYVKKRARHQRNPRKNPAPKEFQRASR